MEWFEFLTVSGFIQIKEFNAIFTGESDICDYIQGQLLHVCSNQFAQGTCTVNIVSGSVQSIPKRGHSNMCKMKFFVGLWGRTSQLSLELLIKPTRSPSTTVHCSSLWCIRPTHTLYNNAHKFLRLSQCNTLEILHQHTWPAQKENQRQPAATLLMRTDCQWLPMS